MKKFVLSIALFFATLMVVGQGGPLPSFQGTTFPALVGQTGSCEIRVADAQAIHKPMKMEFFPEGQPNAIVKDSIFTDIVEIYNIPIGKFHFKLSFHNNMVLMGDCQIGTKMPDGRIIYMPCTVLKYPDLPK